MVQTRIKPYYQDLAESEKRDRQRHQFRRNQIFGLLLVALAVLVWELLRANPTWIFPSGWWRL
jgi:hypothetical protein